MRNFSQFCRKCLAAFVLVLTLAYSTFAGDMQYPGVAPPPPDSATGDMQFPTATSSSETADGEIPYPGATGDAVTEIALTLWQSTLSLF